MTTVTVDLDPEAIISDCYPRGSFTWELLIHHGEQVAAKALAIIDHATWLSIDRDFVWQAAMLHDIGIGRVDAPRLGCTGALPYVCHGVEGKAMLDRLGLPRHGWVCERHVGVGITIRQIVQRKLPLPQREMLPISTEERLICYADKFFSKSDNGRHEKTVDAIAKGLARYGADNVSRFNGLHRFFTDPRHVAQPMAHKGFPLR